MRKHLHMIGCYLRMNLSSAMEYRASFFTQAFGMALSNSSFIFFWWIAFDQIGEQIGGYTFEDILFIWAVTSTAFGLSQVLFANAGQLTRLAVSGELDNFLLQPCNILVNFLFARTSLSAYGDVGYGIVLMIITRRGDGQAWFWFVAAALLGCLMMTAMWLMAHTMTFYVGNASTLGNMVTEFVINFSIYPETIYGSAVRALMYSLIPAGFIVHIPLRLAREFSLPLALALLAAALAYCAAAILFFYRGLRRYESGNAIVTRL